ncbi:MAG TPA: hypothetical protein VMR97_11845 [Acidimicrobiales bacterium]|nr:hypothetical protein [Acidimicrobiales bacterium]
MTNPDSPSRHQRILARSALVLVAGLTIAACTSKTTPAVTTTSQPSSQATAAPPASAASTPTTSPAAADVSITSCAPDPSDSTLIDVTGQIVNHDTQTDDYSITVTLLSGSTRVGEADDVENSITANQKSTWSASGSATNATGAVTCQLASVQRTPSNP